MVKWFKALNPTMQIVIAIAAIILVIMIFRALKRYGNTLLNAADNLGETQALISSGQTKSFSQVQYNGFANQLYHAMKGMGTDEATIYNVFGKMQNDLDVLELTKAYGTRDSYDLQTWLRGDLSSSEMAKLNMILSNKGISKSF